MKWRTLQGLANDACHVIRHIVNPRFFSCRESHDVVERDSHDVASIICEALARGIPRGGAGQVRGAHRGVLERERVR